MSVLLRKGLARLREQFAAHHQADLHHILVEADGRHILTFPHTASDRGPSRFGDRQCTDRLGTPPVSLPSATGLLIIDSAYETAAPGEPFRRHLFFGEPEALATFRGLARRAMLTIAEVDTTYADSLGEFREDSPNFDPADHDSSWPKSWHVWARALHSLAWKALPGSALRAERSVWSKGLILPYDNRGEGITREMNWDLLDDPQYAKNPPKERDLLKAGFPLPRMYELMIQVERREDPEGVAILRNQIDCLESSIGRAWAYIRAVQSKAQYGERITIPPDFFSSQLRENVFESSALAIDIILDRLDADATKEDDPEF